MTREEEIIIQSYDYGKYLLDTGFSTEEAALKCMRVAFIDGARWADEHPKQIEISLEDIEELAKEVVPDDWVKRQDTLWEMIRRNQRAQFIDKACEWLELNVCNAYNFRGDDISIGFVEQFRKAMESGCSEIPNNCEKGDEE